MSDLSRFCSEISADDIKKVLLVETCQDKQVVIDPGLIINFLKLKHIQIDISDIPSNELELPPNDSFRAFLHYPKRVIATDYQLSKEKMRFSLFHEIAHYVLPGHRENSYLCFESYFEGESDLGFEKEANQFAADIMFNDNYFIEFANSESISALTVKKLKEMFQSSFEASARHLIENTMTPCLLVIYEKKPPDLHKSNAQTIWDVKYNVRSPSFREFYRVQLPHDPMNAIVINLGEQPRDIEDSIKEETVEMFPDGRKVRFQNEYFTNSYNVFRISIPFEVIEA